MMPCHREDGSDLLQWVPEGRMIQAGPADDCTAIKEPLDESERGE